MRTSCSTSGRAAFAVVVLAVVGCSDPSGPSRTDSCAIERPTFGVASAAERALFSYDVDAPLQLEQSVEDTVDGVEVSSVSFASPGGGTVTGLVFDPVTRPSPRPGILLMHGMPGTAQQMTGSALTLAKHGAVVIAINAPFARRTGDPILFTTQDRDEQVQLIKDLQRAVDVLRAHPDVDDERIAYQGVSYGGAMGALFVGVEQRIKTAILVVGDGGLVSHVTGPEDEELTALSCDAREAWLESMTPIEPIRFIGLAAMPLLLQNGESDTLVPEADALALHAAAPDASTIRWYGAGHGLNQAAFLDRIDWLHEQIGIDLEPPVPVDPCVLVRPDFGVATEADRQLFAYDASAPLNLEMTVQGTVNGVQTSAISYDSPDGGRVTGVLFDPITRSGPRPAVVLMHGGNVEFMTGAAELLAGLGAVVLAIDAPFARRTGPALLFDSQDRAEQIQLIKDLQRAVDVLIAHPRVDEERIAYQGTGFGGSIGVLFAGIEQRIEGAALVVPDGGIVSQLTGPASFVLEGLTCEVRVAWLEDMTPIEPIRFIPHATAELLLQNGTMDPKVPEADAAALHAAAPEPKTIQWYETGHNLGEAGFLDRVAWLHELIGTDAEMAADAPCAIARPHFGVATEAETSVFAYDANAPLDLQTTLLSSAGGIELRSISFTSPAGGQVGGYLLDPVARAGARPAVVLMHGMPGKAADMIGYGQILAQYGAVVIMIDAPHARRPGEDPVLMTPQDRVEQIQLMQDLQRAVDILVAHPHVDAANIAYVGVSYGGAMGTLFAGIEERLATAVLVVGDGGLVTHSTRPWDFESLQHMGCEARAAWFDAMAPIEPIRFIGLADMPLLFQNGTADDLVAAEDAAELHAAAPASRTVMWYAAGHNLNQQADWDRHDWLTAHIGLDPR